ncbi:MAG: hypothetical protein ABT940_03060, partial [Alphaproteobacteria bacterium]
MTSLEPRANPAVPAVIDLMQDLHKPTIIDLPPPVVSNHGTFKAVILPTGMEIKSLKKLMDEYETDAPDRIRSNAVLTTTESFIEYVNR